MRSLTCLFLVQGEGRGHMTQALALRRLLEQAGHRVCSVLVGRGEGRDIPGFFLKKIDAPVAYLDSLRFAYDGRNRSIRPFRTFLQAARYSPRFRASLRRLHAQMQRHRPDVVVNFFEPMGGLYYALHRPATPMVCIAHQYFFLHPAHRFPPGRAVHREATRLFTRLTAAGAARKLALSLYPVPEAPGATVTVVPPLLRDDLLGMAADRQEPFFLVYLLNSGYAEEIVRWHTRRPEIPLHCFWDRRGAPEVERLDDTLTFHRLDDVKFLSLMSRCRGLITTAGFESVSEAMYLGKPVLAVPVAGHFEQYCNSLDAVKAGAGMAGAHFDIDGFLRWLPSYRNPAPGFRRWVEAGRTRFVREIEAAAGLSPVPAPMPRSAPAATVVQSEER